MKNFGSGKLAFAILAFLGAMMLAGCESTGAYWWEAVPSSFTPGASAETTVRTYDATGNATEVVVPNEPAFQ